MLENYMKINFLKNNDRKNNFYMKQETIIIKIKPAFLS